MGYLPLHRAPQYEYEPMKRLKFRSVFDAGMKYFMYQNGITLLFRKNHFGPTPFQYACGDKKETKEERDGYCR